MQTNKTKPHHNFFIPDNVSVLCFSSYATLLFLVAPILLHTYKPQQYRSFPKYENRNALKKKQELFCADSCPATLVMMTKLVNIVFISANHT